MYDLPTKRDLDRHLSMILHNAHHKARAECARVQSDFVARGMSPNASLIGVVVASVDTIHKGSLAQAMLAVRDFAERMQVPPKQIIPWARPHLENLGNRLLAQIPSAGFPAEQHRITTQYRLVFQQRLDGALRDIEIGFVEGRSLTPTDSDRPAPASSPSPPKELVGVSIDLKGLWRRFRKMLGQTS
jgi:hypothetical protein